MAEPAAQATSVRMSLRDAVAWASSFDALLPHLKAGRIMARASGGFYDSRGEPKERTDDRIPVRWWTQLREVDPEAGRAWFYMVLADQIDDELLQRARHPGLPTYITADVLLATGIELEQAAVEALPEATEQASRHPEATAPAPEAAAQNDRSVAKHGSLSQEAEVDPILVNAFRRLFRPFDQHKPPTVEALLAKPPRRRSAVVVVAPPADTPKAAKSKPPKSRPPKSKPPKLKSPKRGTVERRVFDHMKKNRPHKGDRKYSTNVWDDLGRPCKKKTIQNLVSKYRKQCEVPKRF